MKHLWDLLQNNIRGGSAFNTSPLSMMLALAFSVDIFYQVNDVPFYF